MEPLPFAMRGGVAADGRLSLPSVGERGVLFCAFRRPVGWPMLSAAAHVDRSGRPQRFVATGRIAVKVINKPGHEVSEGPPVV